ncbi:SDR family NAD(P)-dependent oxidoreductase [Actinomadura rugatobispora]|uniref:SDR family NAD(P)-dependent oxidoreductase n=1 Tax=Actinomadura rugatobispora TaxID=1994 RepID=A0ABW0ZYE1_9ACTN|nr:SDR family oxidoreductase [Actinomadura rugatobispora]
MSGRLDGKVVLINGAGSGLGRESALLFAAEGAAVVVTDLIPERVDRVVDEVTAAGGQAVGAKADVREPQDSVDAVALAVDTYGRLDVLMCSAGVPEEGFGTLAFEEISVEGFTSMLATNLTGVFLAARAAVPVMKRQRRGTILAVSSMAGYVAYPGFPGYAAAKHGVNGLVKGMSLSLGGDGIRVNALCPAHGMSANFAMPPDAEVLGKSYEQMQPWDAAATSIPLKLDRPPTLRDNANAALFLVSDESAYISGVCLPATDGGNLARTSIIFPGDLGGDAGVLPPRLAEEISEA